VTVVYNAESVLDETILSVINNPGFETIEYIVLDGASNDGTQKIIEQYQDSIDIFKSEKDSGLYDAMNKAIALCNGKWINFLNAGDILAFNPSLLEKYDPMRTSFVYGLSDIIDENANYVFTSGKANFGKEDFYDSMPICHQAVCYSKKFIKPYSLEYKIIADRVMTYEVYNKNSNVIFDEEIKISFIEGGISHTAWKQKYYEEMQFLMSVGKLSLSKRLKYMLKIYLISPLYSALKNSMLMTWYRKRKYGMR
jgi:glycosyltransferase involved in cell wall biosynthesis